ncbi:hypothetical protein EYF80_044965 [Liparis tanakae]|uniref:Uncharacterized protein n=1 Tax=Liparis tanakae TaxID=230148 RepID=A0A4Z2FUA1_9TELE|nr:hypothetical protein EYF80_044965 [Liparis tanakae]
MCQRDVCSATLYTPDHRPVLDHLRRSSRPLCPQSGQASQQASLRPRPRAGGVGRAEGGEGHKGKLIVAQANSQRSRFRGSDHKVMEGCGGWTHGFCGFNDLYHRYSIAVALELDQAELGKLNV